MIRMLNNAGDAPPTGDISSKTFDLSFAEDVDGSPFIAMMVEDAEGVAVLDLYMDTVEDVDELLADVTRAVEGFKSHTMPRGNG